LASLSPYLLAQLSDIFGAIGDIYPDQYIVTHDYLDVGGAVPLAVILSEAKNLVLPLR